MWNNRRLLELSYLAMVCLCALLLGLGQQNSNLLVISICSALIGTILVDWLKLFSLPRWIANVLSILVLLVTMRGFFVDNSGGQLIAVANLLVYLQSLLMLQSKTPRQYWQLLVLNLLQLVVASVFVLNLEGGVLFVAYIFVSAFFLTLLASYDSEYRLQMLNSRGKESVSFFDLFNGQKKVERTIHFSYSPGELTSEYFTSAGSHLLVWIFVCSVFAILIFILIPRHQSPWFAGRFAGVSKTGATKQVDLDERGKIEQSSELVMKVQFRKYQSAESIQFPFAPYYRGMALGSLVVEDNKTTWKAPYDRIRQYHFHAINSAPLTRMNTLQRLLDVEITLEPSVDPLIYAVAPFYTSDSEAPVAQFCRDLSALTRKNIIEKIEQVPFKYTLSTFQNEQQTLMSGFPYVPETRIRSADSMAGNPSEYRWLTYLDPERYPTTIEKASQIASSVISGNHLEIAHALETHFWNQDDYQYTMDYRTIRRNEQLDPIEDFMKNFRKGHCEVFASALVIMLRSQGIPARLVVGYCGGEWVDDAYLVTQTNAHAWVEAYIRPEDCPPLMFARGEANRGGSWVRLDPTPATSLNASNVNSSSLFKARTFWNEYVLGLNERNQGDVLNQPSKRLLGLLDMGNVSSFFQNSMEKLQTNFWLQSTVIISSLLVLLFTLLAIAMRSKRSTAMRLPKGVKVGFLRRLAATALSLISPKMGYWILSQGHTDFRIAFYERFEVLIQRFGIHRHLNETPRDLGNNAKENFRECLAAAEIGSRIDMLTNGFERIRFGRDELKASDQQRFNRAIDELDNLLSTEAKLNPKLRRVQSKA